MKYSTVQVRADAKHRILQLATWHDILIVELVDLMLVQSTETTLIERLLRAWKLRVEPDGNTGYLPLRISRTAYRRAATVTKRVSRVLPANLTVPKLIAILFTMDIDELSEIVESSSRCRIR